MGIPAGKMDRRIVIQTVSKTQDAAGQYIETPSTFATVWAWKQDITGRERMRQGRDIASETTVFRIRWLTGVTTEMKIVHDGKTYDIEGVAEISRREALDLTATAQEKNQEAS